MDLRQLDDASYLTGKPWCERAEVENREQLNITACVDRLLGAEEDEAQGILIMQESKTTLIIACGDEDGLGKVSFNMATLNKDCSKFTTINSTERNAHTLSLSSDVDDDDSEIVFDCFRTLCSASAVQDWHLISIDNTYGHFTKEGLSELIWLYFQNQCRQRLDLPLIKCASPKPKAPVDNEKVILFNVAKEKEVSVLLKNKDTLLAKKDKSGKHLYRHVGAAPQPVSGPLSGNTKAPAAKLTSFFGHSHPASSVTALSIVIAPKDLSPLEFIRATETATNKPDMECSSGIAKSSVMMGDSVQHWLKRIMAPAEPLDLPPKIQAQPSPPQLSSQAQRPAGGFKVVKPVKLQPPQFVPTKLPTAKKRKLYSQPALSWSTPFELASYCNIVLLTVI